MTDTTITQYAQPLFYFFLKKTGDAATAEDLAADVLLDTLTALRRDDGIARLHAWVWRVARNRYAAWAKEKRRQRLHEADADAAQDTPDRTDLLGDILHREDMALMRRELAFIRRDHRELILAHYIADRPVADIARSLSLPEGTVKARLHRVRNKLREGMQMAREFGPRSYRPENMDFVTSGNMPSALPNSAMKRRLPLNILLEASENPSTIEELSMALGVAAPYMEDEVKLLVDATLMKQLGDKYVTDLYIMDGETAKLLRRTLRVDGERRTQIVREIALDVLPAVRAIHPHHACMTDNDVLWWLLPWVHEAAMFTEPRYVSDFPERACGKDETWGVEGFEKVENPDWEKCFMGRCLTCGSDCAFGWYQYDHDCEAMWERIGQMGSQQTTLLASMLRGERVLSSLTSAEHKVWQSIAGRFAHEENGCVKADVIVLTADGLNRLRAAIRSHDRYPELQQIVAADFDRLLAVLSRRSSAVLHDQLNYVASNEICNSRMMVLNDCLADGTIRLPEKPEASAIGMWLELR